MLRLGGQTVAAMGQLVQIPDAPPNTFYLMFQTRTDSNGQARAYWKLGSDAGPDNNRVEATFPGNPGNPSVFVAFGIVRDEEQPTSFSGLVLDNGNSPVGGARCTLTVNGQVQPLAFCTSSLCS